MRVGWHTWRVADWDADPPYRRKYFTEVRYPLYCGRCHGEHRVEQGCDDEGED